MQEAAGGAEEVRAEVPEVAPQDADLLTGCAPFEATSLDRVLGQLLHELSDLGDGLTGLVARLRLPPSIFLVLAAATAVGEVARRNLQRMQTNPAADAVFSRWPRETA